MSLLLDALKRAEQEKQARPPERPVAPGKPTLELAPVGTPEAAAAARAAPPPPAAASHAAAKLAAPARSRKILWIAAAAILLVIAIIAGYVWYSITALTPQTSARAPVPRPVVAAPAATATQPVASVARAETPVEAPKARAPEARSTPPADAAPRTVAPAPSMLQPTRTADRARIAPQVASGYEALRRGDLDAARRDYAAALAADGGNLDATLGLATVEARSGRAEVAFPLYRRALEIDPRNPTALASLAALSDPARAESLEQQLLRDIAQNPNSASLHLMLGNVYASQSLWTQAQAAYYEAHRLDPGNPDVLHNLAVSLDRIGQTRVAAPMYRRALEASRTQASQVDAAAVAKRLAEIDAAAR